MNHLKFTVHAGIEECADVETEGPTLAIAIGCALPDLARRLGNSRTVLGARPYPDGWRSYFGFHLFCDLEEELHPSMLNRYGTRQPVPALFRHEDTEIEVFDVYETMDDIEGSFRYAAQDLIDNEKYHGLIRERALEYQQAVNDVLIYDPNAKIDIVENLNEIFAGRDWSPFFSPSRLIPPAVRIGKVEVVERSDDTLLLRFEYRNGDESGCELEFADRKAKRFHVRRAHCSALRSFDPPFNAWQLPLVYHALQEALDSGNYTDVSNSDWSEPLEATDARLIPA
jgi:hypothetical protein